MSQGGRGRARDSGDGGEGARPPRREPVVDQPFPSGPTTADDFPEVGPNSLASVGPRGLARVTDFTIAVLAPQVLLFAVVLRDRFDEDTGEFDMAAGPLVAVLASVVALPVVYEAVLVGWRGQTIGKMVGGLRVAQLPDGGPPTWRAAWLRALVPGLFLVSGAIPFAIVQLLILGYPLVYASGVWFAMGQGVHDRAAGTVVVRTR